MLASYKELLMLHTPDTIRLEIIRYVESRNCKMIQHDSDAIGCYGLRPITIKELGFEKDLNSLINKPISEKHDLIALKNLQYIQNISKCDSEECLAYGWLNGAYGLKRLLLKYNYGKVPYRNPLLQHWYVKRYQKEKATLISLKAYRISFL